MRIDRTVGIPQDTLYCYELLGVDVNKYGMVKLTTKPCKYFRFRKRGKRSKNFSTAGENVYEYCKYLRSPLSIGDRCKDCEVGLGLEYLDEEFKNKD